MTFGQGPNGAAFELENNRGVKWWKAIAIVDKHKKKTWVHRSGHPAVSGPSKIFTADDFKDGEVTIEFWKAKTFGIHSYVGKARITFDSLKGKIVKFKWMNS